MKTPKDMTVGSIHETNNFGKIAIIDYHGAKDVKVMFVDTGYLVNTSSDSIRNGHVRDLHDMVHGALHETKCCGKLKIIKYHSCSEVDVEFIDTGYRTTAQSSHIRSGSVIDRLQPSVFGVGFIGDGIYNSKPDRTAYTKWHSMMQRCYSDKYHTKKPTYKSCEVCEEWQDFQSFASWHYDNYHDDGRMWHLDKDIKIPGNNIYSPSTCEYVTPKQNAKEKEDRYRKTGRLISPLGDVVDVVNQADFCTSNGLNKSAVCRMINGTQVKHRGWIALKQ